MKESVMAFAEMQGLYGSYTFSEHLLQKIWLRGEFDRRAAVTVAGEIVAIIHPGRWNRLGGPDFTDARLRLGDGGEITGDVEVHLNAADWEAHRHAEDPAYDRVILHVVLFPPKTGRVTRDSRGHEVPVLALLTLLRHDLEEFAEEEAVDRMAARPGGKIFEALSDLPQSEIEALLRRNAESRWRRKLHFAGLRIEKLGWEGACHQGILEILGFRFNRVPMLRLGGLFPLEDWASGMLTTEGLFASEAGAWSMQGVRPANRPRTRLVQYLRWAFLRPRWPQAWAEMAAGWPEVPAGLTTTIARKAYRFSRLRMRVGAEVCGEAVGGSRFATIVTDGLLPLAAARFSKDEAFIGSWLHWFPGDLPPGMPQALRDLGVTGSSRQPVSNGLGQGLLGWLSGRSEQAARGPSSAGCGA